MGSVLGVYEGAVTVEWQVCNFGNSVAARTIA